MLAKISTILYLISVILHFMNGQMPLFWLTVVMLIVTTGLSAYMSYRQVGTQLKEYRETVWQMEADGASDDEILEFMDQDAMIDDSKLLEAPLWMHLVVTLGIVASFVLFIIGVLGSIV